MQAGSGAFFIVAGLTAQQRPRQRDGLVTTDIYRRLRHPQYLGCALIMLVALAAWPEPINLVMFFVFASAYATLAVLEERTLAQAQGLGWLQYAQRTPAIAPRLR